MPPRPSVPRILVDLPDSSSCSLSRSSTLDIKDVLGEAKLLPKLLSEDFMSGDADDALYFGDGVLQNFPSFPVGRQPPLFIMSSHRARLPFPIRPDAFELGDFCRDEEDACPVLTAPTIPRMKMMIKEQLYVQKWVETLTPDSPPRHIPWTCEKPATKRRWIAEGSVFPADMIKFANRQRGTIQEYSCIVDTNRLSVHAEQISHSRESYVLSETPPTHASTGSHVSTRHVRTKSVDDNPSTLRGESKSHTSRRIVTSRALPTPTSLSSSPPIRTTPDAPLATRRGKSLSGLKLEGCLIELLEYPDIPTAFRGSPVFWSPPLDASPVPSFTDHESMLLDLKSKCAALGSGMSAYIQEPLRPRTEPTPTSLNTDEWAFARGLTTFDDNNFDSRSPRKIIDDTNIFLGDPSTPANGLGVATRLGFRPRPPSMPTSGKRSSDPPGVPLPPRPALINPSTPPHVRGILKKVKSVRFEDVTTKESEDRTPPVVPPQVSPERLSPLPLAISYERPCTPTLAMAKPSGSRPPLKKVPERNIQKRSAARSRPPLGSAKVNEKLDPMRPNVSNTPEPPKQNLIAISAGRPCQIEHAKENSNPATVSLAQAKLEGPSVTEIDVRRGIEGTTKSRLSTPLRNIFRFR